MDSRYKRVAIYNVDFIMKLISDRDKRKTYLKQLLGNDYNLICNIKKYSNCLFLDTTAGRVGIKIGKHKYKLFKEKGTTCVHCGLQGTFFAVEKINREYIKNFHLNLYGVTSNDQEVILTKDHIIPKSFGGKSAMSNYQVLCQTCNIKKGNIIPNAENAYRKNKFGFNIHRCTLP